MSNIVVCYKWVADEADLRFDQSGAVDLSKAAYKISEYDRNAIQAAVDIKEDGDEIVVVSYGDAGAKKSVKEALSRGADKAVLVVNDATVQADGYATSQVLAAAIADIEDVKAVIFSEGASDTYARQVGPRVAAIMDMSLVTNVAEMSIAGDKLDARRRTEDGFQKVSAQMPVAVCVLPEINVPPIPGMKAVLGAGKKPSNIIELDSLGLDSEKLEPKLVCKSLKQCSDERKNIMFTDGSAEEKVAVLVEALKKEGVL